MSAAQNAVSEMFRDTLRGVEDNKILTTVTRAELLDPNFKGFDFRVPGWEPRPYDGKFHPSSHATWTARQLYFYLARPDLFEPEKMSLTSILAITQGKFWHEFLQHLWLRHGILQLKEVPLRCDELNIVGHMDGLSTIVCGDNFEGIEIKTMNDFKLPKMVDEDALRTLYPQYYAQTQDYLMVLGLTYIRYFIMAMSSPYPMAEFVVKANPEFQAAQRAKYREALDRLGRGYPPAPCCAIRSVQARSCPVRGACEIGLAS